MRYGLLFFFFFQAEDGIRDGRVTGVQTCALPISRHWPSVTRSAGLGASSSATTMDGPQIFRGPSHFLKAYLRLPYRFIRRSSTKRLPWYLSRCCCYAGGSRDGPI